MRRSDLLATTAAAALLSAFAILIGASGCIDQTGRRAEASPTAGSVLNVDSLHLVDLDDKPFDLRRGGDSKVHVVVFTRTDCPISNRCAPEVREMFESFHPKGVNFYLIYVDPKEKPETIREHLKQYEYPCTGLRDPQHTLVAQTGATVTPEAVVLDNEWRIVYRGRVNNQNAAVGESRASATTHDLRDAVEATLAGKPVAQSITRAVGCYIGDLK